MSDRNRERKITAAVDCPHCGTKKGAPCRILHGRPVVCRERRAAWQAWNAERAPDLRIVNAAGAVVLTPTTDAARAWLLNAGAYGQQFEWTGTGLRVSPAIATSLGIRATSAGFKVA